MNFTFSGAYPHQEIKLTFERQFFVQPNSVLVFAFYQEKLLFTRHRHRGWELPGGTLLQGESPKKAAIREVYEETGARIDTVELIGQYTILHPTIAKEIKSIYIATIQELQPLPDGFETNYIQLLNPPPAPDEIVKNQEFSMLLKDGVYRHTLPFAISCNSSKIIALFHT